MLTVVKNSRPTNLCIIPWGDPHQRNVTCRRYHKGILPAKSMLLHDVNVRHRNCLLTNSISTTVQASPGLALPLYTEGWPLWTLLLVCAAVGQMMDSRSRLGSLLGGPLISMLCAVGLASNGIIPTDTPAYDVVWKYLMPLAAACFLLDTDMARLMQEGGPVLMSFLVGAMGMVLGAIAGWALLKQELGSQAGAIAASLCASYVGGSINFVAVAQAVDLDPSLVPAAMAADNLAMAAYLAILMSIPVYQKLQMKNTKDVPSEQQKNDAQQPQVTPGSISLSLACAACACALSQAAAASLNLRPLTLTFTALITMIFSSLLRLLLGSEANLVKAEGLEQAKTKVSPFGGASQIGGALMLIFFAVIGAGAGGLSHLSSCWGMMAFLTVMVAVHWSVLLTVGRLLGLTREVMIIGSNANIGGPATAASMAMSKGWTSLVQAAMLVGSLGYAIGTLAGMTVSKCTTLLLSLGSGAG